MKNILWLTFLIGAPTVGIAQASTNLQAIHFEAEGNYYFQVKGFKPQSDVALYSERSGGRLLKTITTDANGNAMVQMPEKQQPAFALSTTSANRAGVSGNGKVAFYGTSMFSLQDIAIKNIKGTAFLSWKGTASDENLKFTVLKSSDGIHFTPLTTLKFNAATTLLSYTSTDAADNANAYYKIEVANKQGGIYTTSVLTINDGTCLAFKVYPNPVNNVLSISNTGKTTAIADIAISDVGGKIVYQSAGVRFDGGAVTTITTSSLATGMYMVHLTDNTGAQQTYKITKK